MPLSEAQMQAVMHFNGPAMVLAGPGSGKTTVITQRARYLIQNHGVSPIHILVVTFTKAAAQEMQKRFLALCHLEHTQVRFGTFHSVFYEILKHAYHLTASNIASEETKTRILKEIISTMHMEIEDEGEFLHDVAREISLVKNERISLEHYYAANVPEEVFRVVYRRYQECMERESLLDYDDLLVCTWELFCQRPDILDGWRRRFQYILVDEFQDINQLQYDVIKLLAAPANNLFIVGDDDQSIYHFRGARPEIMLNFPKEFPNAKQMVLDRNFRCPGNVMDAAAQVIARNTVRFPKQISPVKADGCAVEKLLFQNQTQESLGIIRRIQESLRDGHHYGDVAVLYRTNTDAGILSQKLLEYNIPIRMRDVLPNLFEHWISGHVIAYLKVALGSRERSDILKIINRPKRYIGRECLDTRQVDFDRLRMYYEEKYWVVQRIDKLEQDLAVLARLEPYAAVQYIRHSIGYESYLEEYAQYRHMNADELYEVLDRLAESAKAYRTHAEWFAYMQEYAQMLKEQAKMGNQKSDAVTLATFHSAKGLEFPQVFLIDVNEGIVPYKKAILLSDIEEERRMFYVGMTRASEKLTICVLKEKYGKRLRPSPFLVV